MKLVIVESPNKVKKIGSYLGSGYRVMASFGHVRDLPADGGLAITFNNGRITPCYQVGRPGKRSQVPELKAAAAKADEILLATDPDREGEAISWHLTQVLGRRCYRRVTFNAITQDAVLNAIANPRDIDMHLVDAQQARRVLDRVVGWAVSPTCRKGTGDARAVSAGRVQSVALRMVVEREREISAFTPVEFQSIYAELLATGKTPSIRAKLIRWDVHTIVNGVRSTETTAKIVEACRTGAWTVERTGSQQQTRRPPAPFTTATCQQALSIKLGLSPADSMQILQGLFEEGAITYHRTDSTALSPEAITMARSWISGHMQASYLPEAPNVFSSKSANTQEAHEAIRPTHPEGGADGHGNDIRGQAYRIIWERYIASQMASSVDLVATIDVLAAEGKATFRAVGRRVVFDGWRRLGGDATEEEKDDQAGKGADHDEEALLPVVEEGEPLQLQDIVTAKKKTKAPPRYSQASLIKRLDSDGIGRPSTYATIMSTLLKRGYVEDKKKRLFATQTGQSLIDFLVKAYAGNFIEYTYTASMEEQLDRVARGEIAWESEITGVCRRLVDMARSSGLDYDPMAGEERHREASTTVSFAKPTALFSCKFCGEKIGWCKQGERSIPINEDGAPHHCAKQRPRRSA